VMARSRNIKPGFFKNEYLAELPYEYRLLFMGLPLLADREGRLEDRPKKIKMEIFPADSIDVDDGLSELEKAGFILRYSVDGSAYILVLAFAKHQHPHHAEKHSVIPKPEADPGKASDNTETNPEKASSNPSDSLNLIPDPLNLIPDKTPCVSPNVETQAIPKKRFDEFWAVYPIKREKKKALDAWRRKKLDLIADEIIQDVNDRKLNDKQWAQGYEPHPTTYINGERWDDEFTGRTEKTAAASQKTGTSAIDRVLAGIERGNVDENGNGSFVGDDDSALRSPVGEQLRGDSGPNGNMGGVIEGDFIHHD